MVQEAAASVRAVRACKLSSVLAQFELPSLETFAEGARPYQENEGNPNQPKFGWQQRAARCDEQHFLDETMWPSKSQPKQARSRSQRSFMTSAALAAIPESRATAIDPQSFRVLLCRRRLPLALSCRTCRCGSPWPAWSTVCRGQGVGFAWTRIGASRSPARSMNVMVRDLGLSSQ